MRFVGIFEILPSNFLFSRFQVAKSSAPQTQATLFLKANKVEFEEYVYPYEPNGGAQHSAKILGLDPFSVVKTLIMEDENKQPLVVLMHGNKKVSTKALARQAGRKTVQPCLPEIANKYSGYLVGGTSPFATKRKMPVYMEKTIAQLPKIAINGGRRGFLVGISPQVCIDCLNPVLVECAIDL